MHVKVALKDPSHAVEKHIEYLDKKNNKDKLHTFVNKLNLTKNSSSYKGSIQGIRKKNIRIQSIQVHAILDKRIQDANKNLFNAQTKLDVEKVIKEGADVNAKNDNGNTALHIAAFKGNTDTVEALLAKGADVNAKNNNGYTAFDYCLYYAQKNQIFNWHLLERLEPPKLLPVQ